MIGLPRRQLGAIASRIGREKKMKMKFRNDHPERRKRGKGIVSSVTLFPTSYIQRTGPKPAFPDEPFAGASKKNKAVQHVKLVPDPSKPPISQKGPLVQRREPALQPSPRGRWAVGTYITGTLGSPALASLARWGSSAGQGLKDPTARSQSMARGHKVFAPKRPVMARHSLLRRAI